MKDNAKLAIGAALAGAFILGVTIVAYSSAQQNSAEDEPAQSKVPTHVSTSFSQLEEDEIRTIIKTYLMEHPEIIIEAVNEYSARQRIAAEQLAKDAAAANLELLLDPATSFSAGKNPAKAKVAVIEMFDYHCSFCKRAMPLIKELTEQDEKIKVIFRELPILQQESDYAAAMSLAARDSGKALDYHFAMMDASGLLTKDRVQGFARDVGLDAEKLDKTSQSVNVTNAIVGNHQIASQMGVDGTPTFIVAAMDGSYVEVVNGFRPQELVEAIEAAKKAAK